MLGFEAHSKALSNALITAIYGIYTSDPQNKYAAKFYRRLATMAMAGGIPFDQMNEQIETSIDYEKIEKTLLVLSKVRPDLDVEIAEECYRRMMQASRHGKIAKEALISLFWDPITKDYFKGDNGSWTVCKDIDLKASLDLDGTRKHDLVIMSSRFNLPVLFVDVSEVAIKNGSEHPGYMKTMTNMTVSCIQLAEQMKNCGLEPEDARTFGILVGQDKFHLIVCFPLVVPSTETGAREIYTYVCMSDNWFLDLTSKSSSTYPVLNVNAYKKLSAFLDTVKDSIKKSEMKVASPEKITFKKNFDKPNISYITKPKSDFDANLPSRAEKLKVSYNEGFVTTQQVSKSELQFYKTKLADYFAFPKLLESRVEYDGSVTLTLEKLLPFMGNGIFGPYGRGKCFCPGVIRAENADCLMIDAAVFAVHALFGLFVLHEQLRHLHANITPENIKYSPSDRMWKLTGFDSIIPLKDAHKIVRKCDHIANVFIAPETKKSEIFDKKTDVYALGKVIWGIFHMQIMWLLECGEINSKTHVLYDKFVNIIHKMTYDDPVKRLDVLQSMKMMMDLIKDHAQ